jgi:hypothetical protein
MINKKLPLISYILLLFSTILFFCYCTQSGKEKEQSIISNTKNSNTTDVDTTSESIIDYELKLSGKFIRVDYLLSGDLIIPVYCDATTEIIEWLENDSKLSINFGQNAEVFQVLEIVKLSNGFVIYAIVNETEKVSAKIDVTIHDETNRISKWLITKTFSSDTLTKEFFMADETGSKKIAKYKFSCDDTDL